MTTLPKIVVALLAGVLFGAGLAVAGMTDPNKVLNFLDLSRSWDPSLALVMASAIPVAASGFIIARRRAKPALEPEFNLPTNTHVDPRLVAGSALFGIGWGLGGYCPGPAVASLADAGPPLVAFLVAMTLGLFASGKVAAGLKLLGPSSRQAR